jgi:hypothetical protein
VVTRARWIFSLGISLWLMYILADIHTTQTQKDYYQEQVLTQQWSENSYTATQIYCRRRYHLVMKSWSCLQPTQLSHRSVFNRKQIDHTNDIFGLKGHSPMLEIDEVNI